MQGRVVQPGAIRSVGAADLTSAPSAMVLPGAAPIPGTTPLPGAAEFPAMGEPSAEAIQRAEHDPLARLLSRPVTTNMRYATLEQAAEALSNVGHVQIALDQSLTTEDSLDKRILVEARDIALYRVLEAIASQLDLVVARQGNSLLIKEAPKLFIDGVPVVSGPTDRWDGGLRDLVNAIQSLPFAIDTATGPAPPGPPLPRAGDPPRPFPPTGLGPAPITLSGLGDDKLAVAEPGHDANGAPGYWLTIYKLAGDTLTKVATKFHPAHGAK
jgi:hypothetical protein